MEVALLITVADIYLLHIYIYIIYIHILYIDYIYIYMFYDAFLIVTLDLHFVNIAL